MSERTDWQKRAIDEHHDLKIKIEKLRVFIMSQSYDELSGTDRRLLTRQRRAMISYEMALSERIDRFS